MTYLNQHILILHFIKDYLGKIAKYFKVNCLKLFQAWNMACFGNLKYQ